MWIVQLWLKTVTSEKRKQFIIIIIIYYSVFLFLIFCSSTKFFKSPDKYARLYIRISMHRRRADVSCVLTRWKHLCVKWLSWPPFCECDVNIENPTLSIHWQYTLLPENGNFVSGNRWLCIRKHGYFVAIFGNKITCFRIQSILFREPVWTGH